MNNDDTSDKQFADDTLLPLYLGLLAATDPIVEWLALGALVVSRLLVLFPFILSNPDVRYTRRSLVFLAWAVLPLARLVCAPRRRNHAQLTGQSGGTRRARTMRVTADSLPAAT